MGWPTDGGRILKTNKLLFDFDGMTQDPSRKVQEGPRSLYTNILNYKGSCVYNLIHGFILPMFIKFATELPIDLPRGLPIKCP